VSSFKGPVCVHVAVAVQVNDLLHGTGSSLHTWDDHDDVKDWALVFLRR
jgi:hypothetical protein